MVIFVFCSAKLHSSSCFLCFFSDAEIGRRRELEIQAWALALPLQFCCLCPPGVNSRLRVTTASSPINRWHLFFSLWDANWKSHSLSLTYRLRVTVPRGAFMNMLLETWSLCHWSFLCPCLLGEENFMSGSSQWKCQSTELDMHRILKGQIFMLSSITIIRFIILMFPCSLR